MAITTEDIKLLRESTGAGILDCKKALQETSGDIDQAIEFLRKKGLAAASKKASREANEGLVSAYISPDGKTGVLVEVNCETDFVARTEDFQNFVAAVVQQVAKVDPCFQQGFHGYNRRSVTITISHIKFSSVLAYVRPLSSTIWEPGQPWARPICRRACELG